MLRFLERVTLKIAQLAQFLSSQHGSKVALMLSAHTKGIWAKKHHCLDSFLPTSLRQLTMPCHLHFCLCDATEQLQEFKNFIFNAESGNYLFKCPAKLQGGQNGLKMCLSRCLSFLAAAADGATL